MALQKNILINYLGKDLTFENAYIEVVNIVGNKEKQVMDINIYDTKNKLYIITRKQITFVPNLNESAPNMFKQGYEHLKTLDEYKDAIDLLDEGQTT